MPEPTNDLDVLTQWVGRQQQSDDVIAHPVVRRLELTLDREPTLEVGDPLPPLWHFLFFADVAPTQHLSRDGHPPRVGFLPPVALPRRMWAQSRVEFLAPIRIGSVAQRTSTIETVALKEGSSGLLCFVTVRHELTADGHPCLTETQDLVYRNDPDPSQPVREPDIAPEPADFHETIHPDSVLLFRYSALTFNGHRIHYDLDYAQQVEGYRGLVVHGPLTATLLADLAARHTPDGHRLGSFSFRGVSPLLSDQPFTVAGRQDGHCMDLWAANSTGGLAMTAQANFVCET